MNDDDFKEKLNPEQYRVMRAKDTERPYSGRYWDSTEGGLYSCAYCGTALFSSLAKMDAGNGWPTFSGPLDDKAVELVDAPGRSEVQCLRCKGYLGYREAVQGTNEPRYVVNSASLNFQEFPELSEEEEGDDEKEKQHEQEKGALRSQLQNVLVLLAAVLVGGGVGWASGSALCEVGTVVAPSPTPAPLSPSPTPPTTIAPAPSATPRPSPSTAPATSIAPPASGSAAGSTMGIPARTP